MRALIKKINLADYADMPNPGLISYLSRLQEGQPDDYRTPMWSKAPRREVINAWNKVLFNSPLLDRCPGLRAIEQEQEGKIGPYSIIPPARERIDSVTSYWTECEEDPLPIKSTAIRRVCDRYQHGALNLWNVRQVLEEMKLSTSSGLPEFRKRRAIAQKIAQDGYHMPEFRKPAMAIWGTRVQQGGPSPSDEKVRDVMMMPMTLNVQESQYYYPLLQYEQTHKVGYSMGRQVYETCQDVTALFDSRPEDQLIINTDFSKFDQSFNVALQQAALDVLLHAFNPAARGTILNSYWVKYHIPLLIAKDKAIFGAHGMGSGATGTNPDENRAHKALQEESAELSGEKLNPNCLVLGDDGLITYPGITPDKVISHYTVHGLKMNEKKQYADTHSTYYLQRYYHTSYRDDKGVMLGVYSTERALGRLLGQERYYDPDSWDASQVEYRNWSIVHNTEYHPVHKDFVIFVAKGDKYKLGLDLPGFMENLDSQYEQFLTTHDISYSAQWEKRPPSQWPMYQILREARKKGEL